MLAIINVFRYLDILENHINVKKYYKLLQLLFCLEKPGLLGQVADLASLLRRSKTTKAG